MSATFEIKVKSIRTENVGQLTGVIRKVEFATIGTENGSTFELINTVDLEQPESTSFIQLQNLSEAQVVEFVENNFQNMDAVKAHIQYVLDREVAKASLTESPLPWAPATEQNVPNPNQQ